jgi:hypothetical protein
LLPKTDLLCFADPASSGAPVTVAWDAAMPVVGALMRRTDDQPPRYFVEDFPSALQLAQLADIAAVARRAARAQAAQGAKVAGQAGPLAQGAQPARVAPGGREASGQAASGHGAEASARRRPAWLALRGALGRWADTKAVHTVPVK